MGLVLLIRGLDGDLRRFFEKEMGQKNDSLSKKAGDVMTKHPKTIEEDALAAKALQVMEKYSITSMVIIDSSDVPIGIIHLHDILKAGVV